MSLDLEIQALLRSAEVTQINFTMRGIVITGTGYRELSDCFSETPIRHRIRVTVREVLVGHRTDAVYRPDNDKILLRTPDVLDTAQGRSHVVHECTHALMDLRGVSTPIRSEEGAAYVAEAWYLLNSGVAAAEIDRLSHAEFRTIAEDLRGRTGGASAPAEMTADQINSVRLVIATEFGYGTGHYISDGIRGRIYRGE